LHNYVVIIINYVSAVTVVNGLIVTRLDYCNSLPAGCSKQQLNTPISQGRVPTDLSETAGLQKLS